LTIISTVVRSPRCVVQRAVETLGDAVFGKDIGVVKDLFGVISGMTGRRMGRGGRQGIWRTYAGSICTIAVGMFYVVCGLRGASLSASCIGSEALGLAEGEKLESHIAVWSVDGATEFDGAGVTGGGRGVGVLVVNCVTY